MDNYRKPSLLQALSPIIFLIIMLFINVQFVFGDDANSGGNQLALIFSATIAGLLAVGNGMNWSQILGGMVKSITSALPALMILLLIGALTGTWLISGIVPAMIYYGLDILNPTIFLAAACIVCSIVSIATGSSWSTVGTVGVALLGIGQAMGIDPGIIAGAVISGAYFGDKMSPMSDTTNLAPAMAGTDLITHIKYMTYTTIPSIVITLIIFLIIGFTYDGGGEIATTGIIQNAILENFNITGWLFLVPVAVIAMIAMKVPAIPALLAGTVLGGIFAIIFQPNVVLDIALIPELAKEASAATEKGLDATAVAAAAAEFKGSATLDLARAYHAVVDAMTGDVAITTTNSDVNDLLSTGGMKGMLGTIWLIICAMSFGGVLEVTGMLKRITQSLIALVQTQTSLIITTTATCIGFNVTASDQYLAIVVPGKMFADDFADKGLHPKVLSRTLEDSGTVTSALIPWNTCGAFHASTLNVATGTYFFYCFFNLISPLMTIAHAIFKIKIAQLKDKKEGEDSLETTVANG